jgi:hypothetical protein
VTIRFPAAPAARRRGRPAPGTLSTPASSAWCSAWPAASTPSCSTPVFEISGLMMILFLGGVESTAGLTGTLFKLLA